MSNKLEPVDTKQCQAIKKTGSFMTLGPREWQRCTNAPSVIATEIEPGSDGQRGAMSLCPECREVFEKVSPGRAVFAELPS